ncbi:MAG: DUF4013 domain-containing protein [Anaerolineae bacterium]|nr:DUF4013 domain-containing protein [Anaerolineae bacterium]
MDIGKAFSYVFEDKNWLVKLLIGGVLLLIPIVNFISIGYALRTLRNVAEGEEKPLPEWDNWGDYFTKGLMVFLATLLYLLPFYILLGIGGALVGIAGAREEGALASIAALCGSLAYCLTSVYGLAFSLWLPGALTFYLFKGNFGSMFSFSEIFRYISANIGNYLIAWIISVVASFVASFGVILCVIGVIFTLFWAYLVWAHLFGQVWRAASGKAVV